MKQFNENVKILHPVEERDLHAYIDGQLSAQQRRRVEAYLKKNPDIAQEIAEYREYNETLKSVYSLSGDEDIPNRFQQILSSESALSRYAPAVLKLASVLFLCGISTIFGWNLAIKNFGNHLMIALNQQEQAMPVSVTEPIQPVSETLSIENIPAVPPIISETEIVPPSQDTPSGSGMIAPSPPLNKDENKDIPINL